MAQSITTARDIPILITSTASSSERRITPSWTIAHLKSKLEPVTGIPPSAQKLTLRLPDQRQETPIEAEDEDSVEVGRWPLLAYAEIKVPPINDCGHFLFFRHWTRSQLFSPSELCMETCRLTCHGCMSLHAILPCSIFGLWCCILGFCNGNVMLQKSGCEASSPWRWDSRDWPSQFQ